MRRTKVTIGLQLLAGVLLIASTPTVRGATQCPFPIALQDCDGNGIDDNCDLSCSSQYANCLSCAFVVGCGESANCNGNNMPDVCEADCDGDGIPNDCEPVADQDCDDNGVCNDDQIANCMLDFACADCNTNGLPDVCDITSGLEVDCNLNDRPDSCELDEGETDCNGNAILDVCETSPQYCGGGCLPDCNGNGKPDECDYPPNVLFVDDDALTGGDGSSWCEAYDSLQDALADATSGDEIWVAQGTYLPSDCAPSCGSGDRLATFSMIDNVTIKGGFIGIGAPKINARNIAGNPSILSGALGAVNSYHVVMALSVTSTAVLDGFTVKEGRASGTGFNGSGAGMFIFFAYPSIVDCSFVDNVAFGVSMAGDGGGGVYSRLGGPSFVRCLFQHNEGSIGAGVFADKDFDDFTPARFEDCVFFSNFTKLGVITPLGGFGAGIYLRESNAIISDTRFIANRALEGGGGLCAAFGSDAVITNCLFHQNHSYNAGGIGNRENSNGKVTNCTFSFNTATNGGGGYYNNNSTPTLTNCVFWGNVGPDSTEVNQITEVGEGGVDLSYSCVQGLTGALEGDGNIDDNPNFRDVNGVDNLPGTLDDDLRLGHGYCPDTNRCIDGGSNVAAADFTEDLEGRNRFIDDINTTDTGLEDPQNLGRPIVDMGAFEFREVCGDTECNGERNCTCEADCGPCPSEICGNGVDDDCDGCVDEFDSDCSSFPGSSFPYSEDFQAGLGAWTNVGGDDFDWTRRSGSTPSTGTGPSGDHTTGSGWYMYIETSSPRVLGDIAILESPSFDLNGTTEADFSFWYHMNGNSIGTLDVEVSTDCSTWTNLWTLSGHQGDVWSQGNVPLDSYVGTTVRIRFVGERGASWQGDIAIDDVSLAVVEP